MQSSEKFYNSEDLELAAAKHISYYTYYITHSNAPKLDVLCLNSYFIPMVPKIDDN
jgi:hypothetical protein